MDDFASVLRQTASTELVVALEAAIGAAGPGRQPTVYDLLLACLEAPAVGEALGPDRLKECRARLQAARGGGAGRVGNAAFPDAVVKVCLAVTGRLASGKVTPLGVLLGVLLAGDDAANRQLSGAREALTAAGLTVDTLLRRVSGPGEQPGKGAGFVYAPLGFGEDLSAMAESGRWRDCPLVGMHDLLVRVASRLAFNSVCLTGEPGVGKTALARGLAWHIARRSPFLSRKMWRWRVVSISRSDLLAGTGVQGQLEERLKVFVDHLRNAPEVVPFFDEVHVLLNPRDEVGTKIVNVLKPPMADGSLRCMAATTDREYEHYIMADEPLHSRFTTPFVVPEPDAETAGEILRQSLGAVLPSEASEAGIGLADEVIPLVIGLTDRYQRQDRLPRKAFRFLREVVEHKCYRVEREPGGESRQIDRAFVFEVARRVYGANVDRESPDFWRRMLERLAAEYPGQPEATRSLVGVLRRAELKYLEPHSENAPFARLILMGGESQSYEAGLRVLRESYFGDRRAGEAEDLREFGAEHSRTRLVGAPPGYVGHGVGRTLFAKVRGRSGGGVLHFAHPSAAHPALASDLAAILAGTARDASGNSVDFSQWLVVVTQGVAEPEALRGLSQGELRRRLAGLGGALTRDLLGEVDRVMVFEPRREEASRRVGLEEVLAERRASGVSYPPELGSDGELRARIERDAEATGSPVRAVLDEFLQRLAEEDLPPSVESAPSREP